MDMSRLRHWCSAVCGSRAESDDEVELGVPNLSGGAPVGAVTDSTGTAHAWPSDFTTTEGVASQSSQSLAKSSSGDKPDKSQIHDIFKEVRNYYKGQTKSFNKLYSNNLPIGIMKNEGHDDYKLRIFDNTHYSEINKTRDMDEYKNWSHIECGRYLINRNIKIGNCEEMSNVAAYTVRQKFPYANLHYVIIDCEGEHALILVGEKPDYGSIDSWKYYNESFNCNVVDVWMGISCHIREYPSLSKEKFGKWAERGKNILVPVDYNKNRKESHGAHDLEKNEMHISSHVVPNDEEFILGFQNCTVKINTI